MRRPRTHTLIGLLLMLPILPVVHGCAPVIVAAGVCGGYAAHDRRSVGTQIDDQTLAFRVEKNLNKDPEIKEYGHLNVTAYNGQILITGETPTQDAKARAGRIAGADPNVRSTYNELQVFAPSSTLSRSSDLLLKGKAKASLFSVDLPDFDPTRVKVVVERGIVYLMGFVTAQEAEAATDTVRRVSGVQKVVKIFEYIQKAR